MARSSPILFLAVALLAALLELLVGQVAGIRKSSSAHSLGQAPEVFDKDGRLCTYEPPENYEELGNSTATWQKGGIPNQRRLALEQDPRVLTYTYGPFLKGKMQAPVWSYDEDRHIWMWYAKPDRQVKEKDNLAGRSTCSLCPSCVGGGLSACKEGTETFSVGQTVDIGLGSGLSLHERSAGNGDKRFTLYSDLKNCDLGPIYLVGTMTPTPCFTCLSEDDKDGDVDDDTPERFLSAMSHSPEDEGAPSPQHDDSRVEQSSSKRGAQTTGCFGGDCLAGIKKLFTKQTRASLAQGSASAPNAERETGVAA